VSEKSMQDAWVLLSRARGVGALLRLLALLSPVAALACLRVASGRTLIVVDVAVMLLAACCALVPDTHFGALAVTIFGVAWLVSVHHVLSPWSLLAALALLVFHASLAAASIAAPSAAWPSAVRRRWLRRVAVLSAACVATWLVAAIAQHNELPGSGPLIAAALALVAFAGLWASDVVLHRGEQRGR